MNSYPNLSLCFQMVSPIKKKDRVYGDRWHRTQPRVRIRGAFSEEGTSRSKLRPEGWAGTMVEEKVSGQGATYMKLVRYERVWSI